MTYLAYIIAFGTISVFFLWFRDIHIFIRTSLVGYRKASYFGIVFSGISSLGFFFSIYGNEFIGLCIVCGSIYLQGQLKRERIWTNESLIARFLGVAAIKKDKGKK